MEISQTEMLSIYFDTDKTYSNVNIYIPFMVDEIRVIDSMYLNLNEGGSNPAESYTITSSLFDYIQIPVNNPDLLNYDPLSNFSPMSIMFTQDKNISGSYSFNLTPISFLNPPEYTGVALYVQFVHKI
jgi:hypothetical protein